MKHVGGHEQKTCILKMLDEFERDIRHITDGKITVSCGMEGISFESDTEPVTDEDILAKLSEFYDVYVTSVHIDDCDMTGVWICYKDNKELMKHIEEEIQAAISKWPADHIDMIIDKMSDQLYIGYHSDENSFPCSEDLCDRNAVHLPIIAKLCDRYGIGYNW